MAAYTAITHVGRYHFGDKILVVNEVTGGIGVPASVMHLTRIEATWFQDIDDANPIQCSTYSGTAVVNEEITATKKQLMFCIGYE
jgi:hypothetical protein